MEKGKIILIQLNKGYATYIKLKATVYNTISKVDQ